MANYIGFDLGKTLSNVEQIKNARESRAGAEESRRGLKMKNDSAQSYNMLRNSPEYKAVQSEAMQGNVDAQQQYLKLDPEGAPQFLEAVSKMNQEQRDLAKGRVEEVGRASAFILDAPTVQERQQRYQTIRENITDPNVLKNMPETYSDNWVKMSMAKASTMDKILSNPVAVDLGKTKRLYKNGQIVDQAVESDIKAVRVGDQDIVYKDNVEIERGTRSSEGAQFGGLKAGDENTIFKQVVEMNGGIIDQDGKVQALDPKLRPKVQAMAARASELLRTGGAQDRAGAVQMAAEEFGFKMPMSEASKQDAQDPQNIRNILLNNKNKRISSTY